MVRRQESGYIAFLAVMIVGAATMAIAFALLVTGVDSQRAGLVEQRSKQARALAMACAQEALQLIHDNIAFTGVNNLAMGQGNCTYVVAVSGPTTRTIAVTGLVDTVVRRIAITVTIGATTITVSSWQEGA